MKLSGVNIRKDIYQSTRKLIKIIIKGYLRDAFWLIYGKTLRNPLLPKGAKKITFICKGNICRSPFAQYIAEKFCQQNTQSEYRFLSAGIDVKPSTPPPTTAVQAAATFGISMENHRSRPLDRKMMNQSDMVIAMETWQFHTLRKKYPEDKDLFFLLPILEKSAKYSGKGFFAYNIADPYGKSEESFVDCYKRIKVCIRNLISTLQNNSI